MTIPVSRHGEPPRPGDYLRRLERFVAKDLNTIESGSRHNSGSPYEIVDAFRPFLEEAKEGMGPYLGRLAPGTLRRLRKAFDRVLDATERVFVSANEPPYLGLAHLAGVEDFLVAVNIVLNREITIRPRKCA
jgi:hypothetical protein